MSTLRWKFFLIGLILFSLPLVVHAESCRYFLSSTDSDTNEVSTTDRFLSYAAKLLELDVIQSYYLPLWVEDLTQQKSLRDPFDQMKIKSEDQIHHDLFLSYLDSGELDHARVLEWVQANLKKDNSIKKGKEKARKATASIRTFMVFHRIKAGTFRHLDEDVEITKDFELMQTPVTQYMWSYLTKTNPSFFRTGPDSFELELGGNRVSMNPEYPVENISWFDAQRFIKNLNVLSSMHNEDAQRTLSQIIEGHQEGDIYDFPTTAQLELAMKSFHHGYFNSIEHTLHQRASAEYEPFAWFSPNSKQGQSDASTHAVATRQPRVIDGNEFYDLEGNVKVWVKGEIRHYKYKDKDPVGDIPDRYSRYLILYQGFSWASKGLHITSAKRVVEPQEKTNDIGLRLVRYRAGQK